MYRSPLRTKFRLIICGNVSKTVNNFWFLYLCAARCSQPLVLEPIDFEIITKAPLKNCHLEVKNFRESTDLANYREQGRGFLWKEMLKKFIENTV